LKELSQFHKRFSRNRRGFSTLIATIFMVLVILFFYFNVATFILNRNTDFQDVISRSQQLDADRNSEHVTTLGVSTSSNGVAGQLRLSCTFVNDGSVSVQMVRVWVQDYQSSGQVVVSSFSLRSSQTQIVIEPGSRIIKNVDVTIPDSRSYDSFSLWFVTSRGNIVSAIVN
jgi:hypothetical protein